MKNSRKEIMKNQIFKKRKKKPQEKVTKQIMVKLLEAHGLTEWNLLMIRGLVASYSISKALTVIPDEKSNYLFFFYELSSTNG